MVPQWDGGFTRVHGRSGNRLLRSACGRHSRAVRLFRRHGQSASDQPPPPPQKADVGSATTFHGVTLEEVAQTDGGLYEFDTVAGVPVRLHDADFESLEYTLKEQGSLLLWFAYNDSEYTPPAAAATPVIELRFEGVRVHEWEDDAEAFAMDEDWHAEVKTFDYYPPDTFGLRSQTLWLVFSARTATVSCRPR